MRPVLELERVGKSFGGRRALSDVSFDVGHGEVVGLLGPNGSGKSTLLASIAGLIQADSGRIIFLGRDISGLSPSRRVRLGLCKTFQSPRCFGTLSVLDNMLVTQWGLRTSRESVTDSRALLASVRLDGLSEVPAGSLSGGQKKLLDLVRALLTKPRLLLLDEPTAGVHPSVVLEMVETVRRFAASEHAVLIASHDLGAIRSLCDRVVVLHNGRKIEEGVPAAVLKSARVIEAYVGI